MVEVFKALNGLGPSFLLEIFRPKETSYHLRSTKLLKLPEVLRYSFGIYGLTFRASLLWNQLPKHLHLHEIESLAAFKTKIKLWNGSNCTCYICR